MAIVIEQVYSRILSDFERLTTKSMALVKENQQLLGDFQQANVKKAQHEEFHSWNEYF